MRDNRVLLRIETERRNLDIVSDMEVRHVDGKVFDHVRRQADNLDAANLLLEDAILRTDADGIAEEQQRNMDMHLLLRIDFTEIGMRDATGTAIALDFANDRRAALVGNRNGHNKLGIGMTGDFALEIVRVEREKLGLALQGGQDRRDAAGTTDAAGRGGTVRCTGIRMNLDFLGHFFGLSSETPFDGMGEVCLCNEKGIDRLVVVDPANRLAKQLRNRKHGNLLVILPTILRNRVRHDEFRNRRGHQTLDTFLVEKAVRDSRMDRLGAMGGAKLRRRTKRTARTRKVVHHDHIATFHVADKRIGLDLFGAHALLGRNRKAAPEHPGIGVRLLDATRVRRNDNRLFEMLVRQIAVDNRRGMEMIDGNVEVADNLFRMQIHGQNPIRARRDQKVRHQLGRDGNTRLILAVLTGIPVNGKNRRNPVGRSTAKRIDHDEKLHEHLIRFAGNGLDDKDIFAANDILDLYEGLSIGKIDDIRRTDLRTEIRCNGFCQFWILCAGKDFHRGTVLDWFCSAECGCPTWIRTMSQGTKGPCAAITPSGNV